MRIKLLLVLVLCARVVAFCQAKQELKQWCGELQALLKRQDPFHLQYKLSIKGKGEFAAQENSMVIHVYKKGELQHLVMGDAQDMIQKGDQLLVVNHLMKTMSLQEDSAFQSTGNPLLIEMEQWVDSATTVTKSRKNGVVSFTLLYAPDFTYQKMILSFSESTRKPTYMYSEFSNTFTEPYRAVWVDYQNWDMAWKPSAGFPNLDKYIKKDNQQYKTQPAWQKYEFYQPQKGTLKL